MSRRRKGVQERLLIKISCTGRGSHKRWIFDTVSVRAEAGMVIVSHGAVKGSYSNSPKEIKEGYVVQAVADTNGETFPLDQLHITRTYRCPACGLTKPMDGSKDAAIYGQLAVAGIRDLDISSLDAILH